MLNVTWLGGSLEWPNFNQTRYSILFYYKYRYGNLHIKFRLSFGLKFFVEENFLKYYHDVCIIANSMYIESHPYNHGHNRTIHHWLMQSRINWRTNKPVRNISDTNLFAIKVFLQILLFKKSEDMFFWYNDTPGVNSIIYKLTNRQILPIS